jgi:hypothetical protein
MRHIAFALLAACGLSVGTASASADDIPVTPAVQTSETPVTTVAYRPYGRYYGYRGGYYPRYSYYPRYGYGYRYGYRYPSYGFRYGYSPYRYGYGSGYSSPYRYSYPRSFYYGGGYRNWIGARPYYW